LGHGGLDRHALVSLDQREVGDRQALELGLAIVRAIIEAHSGTITATSEGIGCGATFTLRLHIRAH
jgi:signal transduction histidine kinase